MKKSILAISLMTVAMAVFAIDYPTYKPTTPTYGGGGSTSNGGDDNITYGGYSTTTSGGVTTYGEGAATGPARGPRSTPEEGDHKFENGQWWVYLNGDWVVDGNYHPTDPGNKSDQSPIGTPWIMLLFAAMAAGVVAVRRHRALTVVALLLVCGQGWAYQFGSKNSKTTLIFKNGEEFVIDLNGLSGGKVNAGADYMQFKTEKGGISARYDYEKGQIIYSFTQDVEFEAENEIFHWRRNTQDGWTHSSDNEWYRFKLPNNAGAQVLAGNIPIPDKTGYTILLVTQTSADSGCTFTWSGGTPGPAPVGDHKIDGCDGCFLVEEE